MDYPFVENYRKILWLLQPLIEPQHDVLCDLIVIFRRIDLRFRTAEAEFAIRWRFLAR